MSIEINKDVVCRWVEAWNANDHIAVAALYDDSNFEWRISGLSPVSKAYSKPEIVNLIRLTFANPMKEPLHFTVTAMTAEDERVALAGQQHGVFLDGREFQNFYHILFTLRHGKIWKGCAYFDTWIAVNSALQASLDKPS